MQTLAAFDKESGEQRYRLAEGWETLRALPLFNKVVTWTGEGNWKSSTDSPGREPDTQRQLPLEPVSYVSPSYAADICFMFRVPDSLSGKEGEHVSSPHRKKFVRTYLAALLDAFDGTLLDIGVVIGRRHAHLPKVSNWDSREGFRDGCHMVGKGLFEVQTHNCESSATRRLTFYTAIERGSSKDGTIVEINFDLHDFDLQHLYAEVTSTSRGRAWSLGRYIPTDGVVDVIGRSGDGASVNARSYVLQWLFDSRASLEAALSFSSPNAADRTG